MDKKLKHVIFVYGTLKRACHNYPILQSFSHRFLSEGKTGNEYSLYVSYLPFLVKEPGTGVNGELFLIDDEALEALDRLEGHPHNYKRTPVKITISTGEVVEAWAYIWQREVPEGGTRMENFSTEDLYSRRRFR